MEKVENLSTEEILEKMVEIDKKIEDTALNIILLSFKQGATTLEEVKDFILNYNFTKY